MSKLMALFYPPSLGLLFTYRAGLDKLCVDVFVCWRGCNLQNNLDETTRKVLDENQLAQRLLEQRLQMPLSRAFFIVCELVTIRPGREREQNSPPTPEAGLTTTSTRDSVGFSSLRWASMGPLTEAVTV